MGAREAWLVRAPDCMQSAQIWTKTRVDEVSSQFVPLTKWACQETSGPKIEKPYATINYITIGTKAFCVNVIKRIVSIIVMYS